MAHTTMSGELLRVNGALCGILGYHERELLGHSILEFTHAEDSGILPDIVQRLVAGTDGSASLRNRMLRRDGSIVCCNATISVVRDTEGRAAYVLGVIEDIGPRW